MRRTNFARWKVIVWVIALGAVALRFALLQDQKLTVLGDARYDSRLFIELARSVAAGEWLGPYNERTLIKGPFYPLWIAAVYALRIPLLKAQHALYVLASATAAYALAKPLGPWGALFFFIALLFSPAGYAAHTGMVLREYVSQSLAMLTVSLTLLTFQDGAPMRRSLLRAALLGTALACFRLTREESVWVVPFYAVAASHFLLRHSQGRAHRGNFFGKLALVLAPLALVAGGIGIVSALNKIHYGIWETVELKSRFFRDAYGALTRVRPDSSKPAVPVPREVRMKLYEVSPAFRELRPFLEREDSVWTCGLRHLKEAYTTGTLSDAARRGIEFVLGHDASKVWRTAWDKADKEPCDLYGAWFVWALREAAAAAGHHDSAGAARCYYRRLAEEIHATCEAQTVPCGPQRSSLAPPWRSEYFRPFFAMFGKTVHLAVSLEGIDVKPPYSAGNPESIALFRLMTRDEPMPLQEAASPPVSTPGTAYLCAIAAVYEKILPWFFYAALVLHIVMSLFFTKRVVRDNTWAFALGVLGSFLTLTGILSYIHVTSFPGIEPRYLAPLHPMAVIYTAMVWLCAKELFSSFRARPRP